MRPREISKGGIVLALANQESQEILNFIGKLVAVGPMAGKHERLGGTGTEPGPNFPKIGEYVAFGRYAGQKMAHKGVKVLLLNDDEMLSIVPNPETLQTSK
jgi:co-chaperonin GroES (HSP10)